MKWHYRFVRLAQEISTWSKDPSTKVGCVVVGPNREIRSTGFNGFPRGIADDSRLADREKKYPIICHAEENAIMHAARMGMSLEGCVLYCTWPPCTRCARSIIQVGVRAVVYPNVTLPERWVAECNTSIALLIEAGVDVRVLPPETTDDGSSA